MYRLKDLINKAIGVSSAEFHLVEEELFIALYAVNEKPDFISAFLEISSWMGTSFRSGVWTYYEATAKEQIEMTIRYLQQNASVSEISRMYALGNHDYGNEKYQIEFDYPQEWIDESEIIDKWIYDNEENIIVFLQEMLRINSDYFNQTEGKNKDGRKI